MGIFDKLIDKRVQAKLAPIVANMNTKSYAALSSSMMVSNTIAWITKNPQLSDTLYPILRKRYMKEASIPFYVYKKKDRKSLKQYINYSKSAQNPASFQKMMVMRTKALDEVQIDNDLQRLIQRPSLQMGSDAFWQGVYYEYALREAFIWKNRGGGTGKPVELVLLPSNCVNVMPTVAGGDKVEYYAVSKIGIPTKIYPQDMIHWKTYSRDDRTRGFDLLAMLRNRLTHDEALTEQAVYGAQNHGSDGVLFPKQIANLTETQTTQITDTVNNRVNNSKTRKAVTFLPVEYGYIDLSRAADEMQILEQMGWTFQRLCHVFGIPPEIFISDATFSNKEWALKNWITNDVMPVVMSLRDELNRSLLPDFGNDFFIDADFSALPEMQDDMKKLLDGLTPLFDRGGLSGNELRTLAGFEPTTNALHNQFFINSGYVPLEDMNAPAVDTPVKNYGDY